MFGKLIWLISFLLIEFELIASGVNGQSLNQCRTRLLKPHLSFNMESYLGKWHPIRFSPMKSHQALRGAGGSCLTINISKNIQPNVFNYDEQWYVSRAQGYLSGPHKAQGKVYIKSEKPAVWSIEYNLQGSYETQKAEGVVLATDPNSWAIEYHCAIRSGEIEERIVALSRRRQVDPIALKTMENIMTQFRIPTSNIVIFGQNYCPS